MNLLRRDFIKAVTLAGAATVLTSATAAVTNGQTAVAASAPRPGLKIRGVNLGGWLALERWMSPTTYAGVEAEDEYTLCTKLGPEKAKARLQKHREAWITADDFKWLAARGINCVRLPVGYGILEENPPFVTGRETLTYAFQTAKAHGIRILLDLHGVPGSQNGWDHSGRSGGLHWHTSAENIAHSLRIVEGLAEFCKDHDNLIGVQLLNEPHTTVPLDILQKYYQDAYQRVRKHLPAPRAAVVFHDGFRPKLWADFMREPAYENVILDTHMYQCFTDADHKRSLPDQLKLAAVERHEQLAGLQRTHRCIVGEWSCGLPPANLRDLKGLELDAAMRAYGAAQLTSYNTVEGWFFWSYKLESRGGWNFRDCVERGWLPDKYGV